MDTRRIYLKHFMTNARDCDLEWNADFGKMIFTIRAGFISPALLLDFLDSMHRRDDRFSKTGIIGALAITKRFNVRLMLPSGVEFRLRAYKLGLEPYSTELELYEILP